MANVVAPQKPDFGDLKVHADFHAEQFREGRRSLLSELRCVTGLVQVARAMKQDTLYKLVVPEGQLLQQAKDGLFRGVIFRKGKIAQHAKFAAIPPSLTNVATAVASQVMLVSIAMQLNRIEAMVEGLSREMHRDRIAEIFAGVAQFETAMLLRDPANRRHAILNGVQTLHEGLGKTIAELRDRIKEAPNPDNSGHATFSYMNPFKAGSKVEDAKKIMGMAQESFQATMLGIRTLTECYAALGEGEAAASTLCVFMDKVAACDIRAASQKARLVEFTGDQPPQAVWEAFLKAEPEIRDRLKVLGSRQRGKAAVEIEFTPSDLQGATDGNVP